MLEEKFGIDIKRQPLAHQIVDVLPQKLHHDDKNADAERACKQRKKILQNEGVESLDEFHSNVKKRGVTRFQGAKVVKILIK